ncbi:unnamed protein product [Blumeria hordei]|uniref:Mitochondrial distribution and morphology protein 10 n=2 Tax=Blumeria hordei TaxID=2867405 RepID=A0A383ULR4_BLUHO|nr:mitochondrial inheritance component MDM10 [Blumeria hordei DH14]SZF00756.1 unnamed protein product [Blumeria hordei]
MLEFMEYIQHAWYHATQWNQDNSYSQLTSTARALLEFETPRGLRVHLSSLSSPKLATSYKLGSLGFVDGSLSYLYTSQPLFPPSRSAAVHLRQVIHGYHQVQELRSPDWRQAEDPVNMGRQPVLLYGRFYLPQSSLEALYVRRVSSTQQFKLCGVSDSRLKHGGTLLAVHQYDAGKYATDALYSTDGGLVGLRGLYNFGPDPRTTTSAALRVDERLSGLFSLGAEIYYGSLNKSGGMSLGTRFTTLPAHPGIPLTATLTLNPLMGNVSMTHAVKAGRDVSLCSRFDFNFYSYESELMLGCEIWKMKRPLPVSAARSTEAKLEWRLDPPHTPSPTASEVAGVLKARVDQNWRIGILWEGRVKELLFTLGSSIDMRQRDQPFQTIGLELQYSS